MVDLWPLVDRGDELARARSAAADGSAVLFGGEQGVGKSRLLRELTERLDGGFWTVRLYGTRTLADTSFGACVGLLPPPGHGLDPAGLMAAVLHRMTTEAGGRRVLVAVDDLHLLDDLTAAMLFHAHVAGALTLAGTVRTDEPRPEAVERLLRHEATVSVPLGGLGDAGVVELLTAVLGGPVEERSAHRLREVTSGNPLAIQQVLAANPFRREHGRYRLPETFPMGQVSRAQLVARTLAALPDPVRDAVELVALADSVGVGMLVGLTSAAAVDAAVDAELIRAVPHGRRREMRIGHPLFREVALARLDSRVRRERHLQALAAAIVDRGARRAGDALRVGTWLLSAGVPVDAGLLTKAAHDAYGMFDIPLACRLARAAIDNGGGLEAVTLLAVLEGFRGNGERSLELLDAAAPRLDSDDARAQLAVTRCVVEFNARGDADATDRLRAAGAALPGAAGGLLWPMWAVTSLWRGDFEVAAVELARLGADRSLPDAGRLFAAVVDVAAQAYRGGGEELNDRLDAMWDDTRRAWAVLPYLRPAVEFARWLTGTVTGRAERVVNPSAAAEVRFFPLFDVQVSLAEATYRRLRGRLEAAYGSAVEACALAEEGGGVFASTALAEAAALASLLGHRAEAATRIAEARRRHSRTMTVMYPWVDLGEAQVRASAGDVDGAVAVLDALTARLRADRFDGVEVHALQARARYGRADAADALAADALAARVGGAFPAAVAAHVRGVADGSGEVLSGASVAYEELGLRLYAAEAAAQALNLARAAHRPGSGALAERVAALWPGVAHTPALMLGLPTDLGERDELIVRLAGAFHTSGQIRVELAARHIYLSTRTVEGILTRAYAALGVNRRAELDGFMTLLDAVRA